MSLFLKVLHTKREDLPRLFALVQALSDEKKAAASLRGDLGENRFTASDSEPRSRSIPRYRLRPSYLVPRFLDEVGGKSWNTRALCPGTRGDAAVSPGVCSETRDARVQLAFFGAGFLGDAGAAVDYVSCYTGPPPLTSAGAQLPLSGGGVSALPGASSSAVSYQQIFKNIDATLRMKNVENHSRH